MVDDADHQQAELKAAAFACQPGYALDRELLPEIEAAVAFLQGEVAQIRLGKQDHRLQELIEGPPLPGDKFQTLMSIWKVPAIPAELAEMLKQLQQVQLREQQQQEAEAKARQHAETKEEEDGDEEEKETEVSAEESESKPFAGGSSEEQDDKDTGDETMDGDHTASSSDREETAEEEIRDKKVEIVYELPRTRRGRKPRVRLAVESDESVEKIDAAESAESDGGGSNAPNSSAEEQEAAEKSTVEAQGAEKEDGGSKTVDTSASQSEQDAEAADTALASLRTLRKSMLLDVLSKITSVAKSKGVDPAMFSSRKSKEGKADFMDLETISSDVQSGVISEWEVFAHQVYLFCQHVIADSEKRDQQDAKQKGVELLHFARTLTETLRKASMKKEESLLKGIESKSGAATPSPRFEDVPSKSAVKAAAAIEASTEKHEPAEQEKPVEVTESDKKAKTPPPPASHSQASPKRPSVTADPMTPNRISARIRQRGSSFSDLTSPQGQTPRNDDSAAAAAANESETKGGRKRPRAASNASSATATPPPAVTVNTASEDENMSESESQISASEAESQKRRGSSRSKETASASSSAQTTPVKRAKTRKRRPVLPATRMSSRQQKRRAARAKAATESTAGDDDDEGKEGSENNEGEDDTTAQGDDDDDDNNSEAADPGAASPPPVLLTKAGRPRKKPGRKPAGWKTKADGK